MKYHFFNICICTLTVLLAFISGCLEDNSIGTVLFAFISGCAEDNSTGLEDLVYDAFPLTIGNRWEYHVYAEENNIFANNDTTSKLWEVQAIWKVKSIDRVFGIDAFRVETTHHFLSGPDSGKTAILYGWFTVIGDTLITIASQVSGMMPNPIEAQLHKITINSEQDEPEDWEVNVLVSPLEVGKAWPFTRFDLYFGTKMVEALEEVDVPAGNFQAYRIVRNYYNSGSDRIVSYQSLQWFSSVGIVRMTSESNVEYIEDYRDVDDNIIFEKGSIKTTNTIMELIEYQIE